MDKTLLNEVQELMDPGLLAKDLLEDFQTIVHKQGAPEIDEALKEEVETALEFLAELAVARMKGDDTTRAERWMRTALLNYSFGGEAKAYLVKRAMHESFEAKFEKIAIGLKALGQNVLETTIKAAIDGVNPLG